MEEITPQERSVLREYFRANAVPTQEQFWQFIEATLNNVEDGITKTRGTALRIRPATSPGSQALELFKTQTGTSLAWTLEVVPQLQGIDRPGLHFYQPGHTGTLYLRESDGAIGMGTLTPNARLQIISTSPDSWRHDEVFNSITLSLGAEGQGKPGSLKLQGSALNDFALIRQASGALMIDSSNGDVYFNRDNGVRQFVGGSQPDTVLHIMNGELQEKIRLHAGGDSYFQGGRVGIGVGTPAAPLHVEGGGEARVEDRASGALVIGNPDSVHLAVDSDAILAKSDANHAGTLRLQPQGGLVDIGGDVHIQGHLELDRDLTLHEDLIVEAELDVLGAARLHGTTIEGHLSVIGQSDLHGTHVQGPLAVDGDAHLHETAVNGDLYVTGVSNLGTSHISGSIDVAGQSDLHSTHVDGLFGVTGQSNLSNTHVDGLFGVTGQSNLKNTLVDGLFGATGQSNLKNTAVDGQFGVSGHSHLHDTQITGSLGVTGLSVLQAATLSSTLSVGGAASLHDTGISGSLSVSGNSLLHTTHFQGDVTIDGHSLLKSANLNGQLGVGGDAHLHHTAVNGELQVSQQSNLHNTEVNGSLVVTGQSHMYNAALSGYLTVAGPSTLQDATLAGQLQVQGHLHVQQHAHIGGILDADSLIAQQNITAGGTLTTGTLHVQQNSSLGNADAMSMQVTSDLLVGGQTQLAMVNAANLQVNGTLQSATLSTTHLAVLEQANLGYTNIMGALHVQGDANLNQVQANHLYLNGFLQANNTEFSTLQVLDTGTINTLSVGNSLNAQQGTIMNLNAQNASIHNLQVTGALVYPGMNVQGPANFMELNIDGGINFMQGAYRMQAAAAELRIGPMMNNGALKILQDGQMRINMEGASMPFAPYYGGRSDLMVRGRMDIVDGSMEPYDPSYSYPLGGNYRADLIITGHRSRLAIASDIYAGSEPGSSVEFAARDGGANSAFVFSIEQLRNVSSGSYPPYGNSNMPGSKLGFYMWHRETESDTAFGYLPGQYGQDRIPFAIDGAKFRVGVGTSNPKTRLEVLGQANLQALQMVVTESDPGPLEMEYSGNFNYYPSSNSIGGASIGFASEITTGLPSFSYGPQQEGYVPNLFGKIGLHRNPYGTSGNLPGLPEESGIELSSYHNLPIRMRINEQTMLEVRRELQHARVEVGIENGEPSILKVHGNLEVTGTIIHNGAGQDAGYQEVTVPGSGQDYVPIAYQEVVPDGSLLEVEFFTGTQALPCIFQMRSFYYNPQDLGSTAGILQVQTLHPDNVFGVADATLAPMGYRVIWVKSGHTYRWRSNRPITMLNAAPPVPGSFPVRSQPVPELGAGTGPTLQGFMMRQV
jgi:cytoskeletal protein CcmA (bactofilin family)